MNNNFEKTGYLLKQAQQQLRRRMDGLLEKEGLTMAQYVALSLMEMSPHISNAQMARRAFVTPQTMHRIVKDVESAGLAKVEAEYMSRKLIQRVLTEKGKEKVQAAHITAEAVESRMLEGFLSDDIERLNEYLKMLVRNLSGNEI